MAENSSKEKQDDFSLPRLGEDTDENFLKTLYPKPDKNMKWVYDMFISVQGIKVQAELVMEVVDIIGKIVKIKTTLGDQSFENTSSLDSFAPLPTSSQKDKPQSSGFIFLNNEDLKIAYGELRETFKFSNTRNGSKSLLWLASGIGPVKYEISSAGMPATLELREFTR